MTVEQWQAAGVFVGIVGTTVTAAYLTVIRPLIAQLTALVAALNKNTDVTATSASAIEANTVATAAITPPVPGLDPR